MTETLREEVARAICCDNGNCNLTAMTCMAKGEPSDYADAAIAIVLKRAAEAGKRAVNQCRGDGETDLRSVRELVFDAIIALETPYDAR